MQFFRAIRYTVNRLQRELPEWLTYHTYDHVKDVYRMSRLIGRAEGLDEDELKLVLTAAILHDSGFTLGTDQHEQKSCDIAREILPRFGYKEEQIETITSLIMATAIPHKPLSLAHEVLCDADLDYLGRDDFQKGADSLFRELMYLGIVKDKRTWNNIQVKFLTQHRYFTKTSIESRLSKKAMNLASVVAELAAED